MKIQIMGKPWKYRFVSAKVFYKRQGTTNDVLAITDPHNRIITFRRDVCTIQTIVHELAHAYYSESMTESANLDAAQVEEVFCSLVSEHLSIIDKQSKKIFKEFSALPAPMVLTLLP